MVMAGAYRNVKEAGRYCKNVAAVRLRQWSVYVTLNARQSLAFCTIRKGGSSKELRCSIAAARSNTIGCFW
jgi:hypothetical protein